MVSYQVELLAQLADRLNRYARVVPWVFAAVGAGGGLGAGFFVATALLYFPPGSGSFLIAITVPCVMLGAVAYFLALGKALALRLQAQTALCQMKTEENTRAPHR